MARDIDDGVLRFHEPRPVPREFVIHRAQCFPHEESIELAGGRLVEIGSKSGTSEDELGAAIGVETAGILFVAGSPWAAGALPLDVVVRLAHERAIPVIVDAAAQLPPPDNLWAFTAIGADLVVLDRVIAGLVASPPRIAVEPHGSDAIHVAPETLVLGEEVIVGESLGRVLDTVAANHHAVVSEA